MYDNELQYHWPINMIDIVRQLIRSFWAQLQNIGNNKIQAKSNKIQAAQNIGKHKIQAVQNLGKLEKLLNKWNFYLV